MKFLDKIGGLRVLLIYTLAGFLAMACANRGSGPQGGPKDVAPPIPVSSKPENGALNYNKNKVEISFDEIVLLEKAFEKVVVSPPQTKSAIIKAYGRKVNVELLDSLKPNTTYIIDFADAIVDNNEKNPLKDYYFTFSTGEDIDSLMLGGTLLDAQTLNPMDGLVVGIHSNLEDSAFTTQPFDRVTKTDQEGRFWIKGIAEGKYKIYALADMNSNFRYDKGETLAFLDSVITPKVEMIEEIDTIWQDSVTIDTIIAHTHPKYTAGVTLRGFNENYKRPYFIKAERPEKYRLNLYFNTEADSLPVVTPLNFALDSTTLVQWNPTQDTLTYWFADTLLWQQDTLEYELTYRKTDSLENLVWQTDTLNTIYRVKKEDKKQKKENGKKAKKTEFLPIKSTASSAFDLYNPVKITFNVPTTYDSTKNVIVEQKIDTLWRPINAKFEKIDSLGMTYQISYEWQPEKTYRITIDSAAFFGIDTLHTDKLESTLKIKSLESYATLYLIVKNLQGNEMVELLDKSEKVVRTKPANAGETVFEYLNPGDYYLRLFVDENQNGVWDTGNYAEKRQPEMMYYFPYKLTLRAFWEVEDEWDYRAFPLIEQKPKAITEPTSKKKK